MEMNSMTDKRGYLLSPSQSLFMQLGRTLERVIFVVIVLALIASVFIYRQQWMPMLFPPIKQVQLQGQFIHIDRLQIERLVQANIGVHFFDTDLHALRQSLEAIAWIKHAFVKRVWPQTLHVEIEEHHVEAHWGTRDLISSEAVVFTPEHFTDEGLPILYASVGKESIALKKYREANNLLEIAGVGTIKMLAEDRRGMWKFLLNNGIFVKVGDVDWMRRLQRLLDAWRGGLSDKSSQIRCIDLRYFDGLAVAWKDQHETCE